MAKNDLLKEAIADAKAVRETAIANAKLALQEAFTPKLQSMLSTKIQEEEDEDVTMTADEDPAEVADVADDTTEIAKYDEDTEEETAEPGDEDDNNEMMKTEGEDEDEMSEGDEDEDDVMSEEEEGEETDMELESIIRELEDEDDMAGEEEVKEGEEDDKAEPMDEAEEDEVKKEEEDEMDLEEVINALKEEGEEEDKMDEEEDKDADLEEAYETIRFLKDKINEVNLLNAKLLFSNKLFRANDLNEGQKMKVIETFDRANSVREVKLVYSTLAESLPAYSPKRKRSVTEGFASKSTNSTKPNKSVIVESNQFANRMKKLAGLL